MPNLFGLKQKVARAALGAASVSTNSTNSNMSTGSTRRTETVTLQLAGTITQVLPNGNFVVSGIVRPQDSAGDNTITHDRMAEARISYGGKGQLTGPQTLRHGQPLMDIILPS